MDKHILSHFSNYSKVTKILIYFLAFRLWITAFPAVANGSIGMIFGRMMGPGYGMLIFGKSGSKVKGQGQISTKICLLWADFGHRGCVWGYSGPGTGFAKTRVKPV